VNTARERVLARIREALAGDRAGDATREPERHASPAAVPRAYRQSPDLPPGGEEVVELLTDRLLDYRAQVCRVTPEELPGAVREALAGVASVVIPPGLPDAVGEACREDGREVRIDGTPHEASPADLDRIDAVVTTATVAAAVNGMIVLDGGPGQGRRAISLVPDLHVVVLRTEQVVETVPEAIGLLDITRPITMIAGPSATSDIELQRVEGVHGPRTLRVLLVGEPASDRPR
jgi:L-lactate dehydrogenase complex protein LldG